jgi:hypothetical protein
MPPILIQIDRGGLSARRSLAGASITIGREPDNTVQILDKAVSRHHCRIESRAARTVLVDLGSTHLTRVNGQAVERTALAHGDLITVAEKFDFIYVEEDDPQLESDVLCRVRRQRGTDLDVTSVGVMTEPVDHILGRLERPTTDPLAFQKLREEVDRRASDLQCLFEIGSAINSELDPVRLLDLIVANVVGAAGAERGFVLMCDASGELRVGAAPFPLGPSPP